MANIFRRVYDAVAERFSASARARAEVQRLRGRLESTLSEHRRMLAKVDAADNGEFERRLWERADALGPNSCFSESIRALLRNRGRHEALNNNYARGLVRTHAYDLIGTCPRPQLTIPGDDSGKMSKPIEQSFIKWAKAAGIGQKFRIMEKSACRDGDIFGLFINTPQLKHKVKLNLRLLEAEMCQSPWNVSDANVIDGIKLDENGEKIEYYFLRQHPGESLSAGSVTGSSQFYSVPARLVLHWLETDRAGQIRGVPRISAALPLFAQQRRYTLAVITAAEFASMIAGVMKTNASASTGAAAEISDWSMFEIIKGALLSLPAGWDASPFKSDQPTTTYPDFKREILNEVGRGSGAPLNVVSGNSTGYNFSSAKCDMAPYRRDKKIERYDFEAIVVDPTFAMWELEARAIGIVPADAPPIEDWLVTWNYDGFGSIDEVKDATADDIRLKDGTSTLKEILAEYGQDVFEHMDQLAKERDYAISKGLPWPVLFNAPVAASEKPQDTNADPVNDKEDVTESKLRSAMEDHGVPDHVVELVADAIFPIGSSRRLPKPSRNGHTKGVAK